MGEYNQEHNAKKMGLTLDMIDILKHIFLKYPNILQVKVYGSRAKGNYKVNSDIDLAIYTNNDNQYLMDLNSIESDITESILPYLVDIQNYNQINNQDLLEHIDRIGVVIFDRTMINSAMQDADSRLS